MMDRLSEWGPLFLGGFAAGLSVILLILIALSNNGTVSAFVVFAAILCPALVAFQLGWRFGADREGRW